MKNSYFLYVYTPLVSFGVEVAPRISDREIIESLAELKIGQRNMSDRFLALERNIDSRFLGIDKRFQSLEESIGKRFESLEKRFTFLESLIMIVIAGIFGLIGFIVWDRKTALRPLE